ncbi:hypothetical protein HPB51_022750 [Rhipicephalus microplus]|uniref:Cytochrome n=1 Tax=Rhipicephalus microplus TaxID=6941 RepID=A0A9J6EIL6_RHIMP|nr:hypothetical protein HPB51_022750 [Rhipicephalus microplus]
MMNLLHWSDTLYSLTQASKEFKKNINFVHEYNRKGIVIGCEAAAFPTLVSGFPGSRLIGDTGAASPFGNVIGYANLRNAGDGRGFETTAISIAYTLFLLGNHPEVQAKVHEEIDAIFVEDVERDVTAEDIKQMKYLECVVKESMRLYPPVPLIARDVDEDMKVGQKFANLEDKILLTQIMRRYTVTSKLRMDQLQLSIEVVLKAIQGLEIKIRPRNKAMKED